MQTYEHFELEAVGLLCGNGVILHLKVLQVRDCLLQVVELLNVGDLILREDQVCQSGEVRETVQGHKLVLGENQLLKGG